MYIPPLFMHFVVKLYQILFFSSNSYQFYNFCKRGDGMPRDSLKSLKNKTVTVIGRIEHITITPKVKIPNKPIFSKILLIDVNIGGQYFDHVWVYASRDTFITKNPFTTSCKV